MEADIIAVSDLSRLEERVQRSGVGDTKVDLLHFDMLVARVLRKGISEREFFRRVLSRRRVLQSSTNMEDVRKWATGLQVKCRAACLDQNSPKLLLNVSDNFTQRHPLSHQLLLRASAMPKSRWTINGPASLRRKERKETDTKVLDISHLKDVDALVGNATMLDKVGCGPKSDSLAGVLFKRKHVSLQETAQSSGGA